MKEITKLLKKLGGKPTRIEEKEKILGFRILDNDTEKCLIATTGKDEFQIYLNQSVGDQFHYENLILFLRKASLKAKINIFINNYGGSVHTAVQLINAIRDCKGEITGICDSAVYSAAPLLLLSCPKIVLKPNTMLMFHDYASWNIGRGHEQRAQAENMTKHLKSVMISSASPFLSEKEIEDILEGKDMYFHFDEAQKRLRKHRG